ncbi:Phosphohydrolase (MutT/nudix family protein) [Bacillus sp. NRRL B-14911]|uniref:DNA mismatch repair protein MutT n=1 Tax=Bacillus infantis NRRL B-14911 TaxID=1367477 RepID=U5LA59_9BACI|nr:MULTISPECIES: NUDIX domain-containing protein [Bacillus]AGX04704.1 DNA mismatch repair protein MutT [Bacillus infantis NRRL B-14911]EAR68219.1 Phosphohydrolase (MutT/nudix family protein) [Bacillus sp. NRRL B-14911]RYI29533.1 NUDIX domain-containing protein [Bacillus infantis]
MRICGRAVIVKDGKVALIKRIRESEEYYVFPGGGAEPGELAEEAAAREVLEELGIEVKVGRLLVRHDFDGPQFFYFAEMRAGIFGSGTGEEFDPAKGRGTYEPLWVDIGLLADLPVRPAEVANLVRELRIF